MFQDFEGFPKRYYGESSISESLWDWMDLNADDRELLEIYIDEVNDEDATIDQAREAFMGKYDSEQSWAQEFVDDVGLSKDQLNYYLTLSDTDAEMIASEEADSLYDDREDDEILEEADMAEEYEAEEDEGKKDAILEKAKEKVKEAYSDEVEAKLKKDPVGYFVDDLGAYSIEDLAKANFMSIDYEAYARDARLGGDVSFVRKYGETWVFSNNV
jgi:antirestriction protein